MPFSGTPLFDFLLLARTLGTGWLHSSFTLLSAQAWGISNWATQVKRFFPMDQAERAALGFGNWAQARKSTTGRKDPWLEVAPSSCLEIEKKNWSTNGKGVVEKSRLVVSHHAHNYEVLSAWFSLALGCHLTSKRLKSPIWGQNRISWTAKVLFRINPKSGEDKGRQRHIILLEPWTRNSRAIAWAWREECDNMVSDQRHFMQSKWKSQLGQQDKAATQILLETQKLKSSLSLRLILVPLYSKCWRMSPRTIGILIYTPKDKLWFHVLQVRHGSSCCTFELARLFCRNAWPSTRHPSRPSKSFLEIRSCEAKNISYVFFCFEDVELSGFAAQGRERWCDCNSLQYS